MEKSFYVTLTIDETRFYANDSEGQKGLVSMKILTAEFVRSAESKKDYPNLGVREIAFAGRSNVGKSSLVNTLLGRRTLVKVSKTPGHTRTLNFFLINKSFAFIDLPGYGFARAPKAVQRKWGPMMETYLTERGELACVVLVVDVRRSLTDLDKDLIEFLAFHERPVIIAATKADKMSTNRLLASKRSIAHNSNIRSPVILFSSHNGLGKKELWKEIKQFIQ
jgi:GTP-binding protein